MTSISSLSSNAVSVLFASSSSQNTGSAPTTVQSRAAAVATGNTDDALKTGGAIGKIIEIVAGMSQSDKVFDVSQAQKVYNQSGGWSQTETGTGLAVSPEQYVSIERQTVDRMRNEVQPAGPEATRDAAYVEAYDSNSIQKTDMTALGVTATMTDTKYYYADGRDRGESGGTTVTGMDQFLANYTYRGADGLTRDKATGKYAGFDVNGTQYTYIVYGPTEASQQGATAQSATASA